MTRFQFYNIFLSSSFFSSSSVSFHPPSFLVVLTIWKTFTVKSPTFSRRRKGKKRIRSIRPRENAITTILSPYKNLSKSQVPRIFRSRNYSMVPPRKDISQFKRSVNFIFNTLVVPAGYRTPQTSFEGN